MSEQNIRLLIASQSSWEEDRLVLPEKCGRKEIAAKAKAAFLIGSEPAYLSRIGLILRLNSNFIYRWLIWEEIRLGGNIALAHAVYLGLFLEAEGVHQRSLIEIYGNGALQAFLAADRWDDLESKDRVAALHAFATGGLASRLTRWHNFTSEVDTDLFRVYLMLHPSLYGLLAFERTLDVSFESAMMRLGLQFPHSSAHSAVEGNDAGHFDVTTAASRVSRASTSQWRTSLEPWSDFIESVRRTWGECIRVYCLAAIAAGIISKEDRALGFDNLFDQKLPLVERARCARLKYTTSWWRQTLESAVTDDQIVWALILILAWGTGSVIRSLSELLEKILNGLSADIWNVLASTVRMVISSTSIGRHPLSGFDEKILLGINTPRLKATLALRLPRILASRELAELMNRYDGDDQHLIGLLISLGMDEVQREPKFWKELVVFLKRHGAVSMGSPYDNIFGEIRFYYGHKDKMPALVAQEVAKDRDKLPVYVLEAAEISLLQRSGSVFDNLQNVSVAEGWFD